MRDFVNVGKCCRCKVEMMLPRHVYRAALESEEVWFYCCHGHQQHFSARLSEAEVLRQERDRLKQHQAYLESKLRERSKEIEHERRRTAAQKAQVTRLKNRSKAGLCPCCNRHFTNLERHIATKHPDIDNVIDIEEARQSQ